MSDPTPPPTDSELRVLKEEAVEAARLGGRELRDMFGTPIESRFKSSARDFVTAADLASEKRILTFVEDQHPDHGWQSEEAGLREAASPYRWVIDPLDGSSNFAHGYPHFSVSVAVLWHNRSLAGAVYDPMRDECFDAAAGQGAMLNGQTVTVSDITTLDRALVSTGFPYAPEGRAKVAELTARAIEAVQMLRRSGSAALDLAYVAGGRSEAHWEFDLNLHDVAAGLLLVREAGGYAAEMRYPNWPAGYLAANGPAIADAVHELIEQHFGAVLLDEPAALTGTAIEPK